MKAKTKLMATALVVFMAFQASAQVSFGLRVSAGMFNLVTENNPMFGEKLATRLHHGLFVQVNIAPHFSIQPSMLLANKGSKLYVCGGEFFHHASFS